METLELYSSVQTNPSSSGWGEGGSVASCVHTGTMTRDTDTGTLHDSVSTRLYCDGLWVIVAKHVFLWNWFLCISLNNFLWCWKQKVDIIDRHKLRHRGVQKLCVKWNMLSRRPSSDWMLLSHLLKVFKSEINGCVLFKFYVNCTKFKFPNEAECVMSKLPIVAPAHCTRGNITND